MKELYQLTLRVGETVAKDEVKLLNALNDGGSVVSFSPSGLTETLQLFITRKDTSISINEFSFLLLEYFEMPYFQTLAQYDNNVEMKLKAYLKKPQEIVTKTSEWNLYTHEWTTYSLICFYLFEDFSPFEEMMKKIKTSYLKAIHNAFEEKKQMLQTALGGSNQATLLNEKIEQFRVSYEQISNNIIAEQANSISRLRNHLLETGGEKKEKIQPVLLILRGFLLNIHNREEFDVWFHPTSENSVWKKHENVVMKKKINLVQKDGGEFEKQVHDQLKTVFPEIKLNSFLKTLNGSAAGGLKSEFDLIVETEEEVMIIELKLNLRAVLKDLSKFQAGIEEYVKECDDEDASVKKMSCFYMVKEINHGEDEFGVWTFANSQMIQLLRTKQINLLDNLLSFAYDDDEEEVKVLLRLHNTEKIMKDFVKIIHLFLVKKVTIIKA